VGLAEVRSLQPSPSVRAGVVVCLVLTLLAGSASARDRPSGRPHGSIAARLERVARIYRLSLHETVRNGHRRAGDNVALATTINVFGAAAAYDRRFLTPLVLLGCLAFSAEAASGAGWRDGRVDRKRGWVGLPFRGLTHVGVAIAVGVGLPPMRRGAFRGPQ